MRNVERRIYQVVGGSVEIHGKTRVGIYTEVAHVSFAEGFLAERFLLKMRQVLNRLVELTDLQEFTD